jgi:sulfite oxidase
LRRLWVRDRVHDGLGMNGKSYRLPKRPLRPGDYGAPDADFAIFTTQPVRSLIVRPPRCTATSNATVAFSGKAWSGSGDVRRVELTHDSGLTWIPAAVEPPANRWAWQSWELTLALPSPGVWYVHARATDETGVTQPMLATAWNPGGYANNQAMQVDVEVLPAAATLKTDDGGPLAAPDTPDAADYLQRPTFHFAL